MDAPICITARLSVLLCAIALLACSNHDPGTLASRASSVECKEPRPELCPQVYNPVCATRDNGVRCVTTPCQSTEQKTYSNGCMACADPAVYHYQEGACEQ